jgi:hypothetical protein
MASTKENIKSDFRSYIGGHGPGQYGWYIGIAKNARERLFNDHNVNEKGAWIYDEAIDSTIARQIEVELIKELKTKGGDGGGDFSTKYVYAYKITEYTKE